MTKHDLAQMVLDWWKAEVNLSGYQTFEPPFVKVAREEIDSRDVMCNGWAIRKTTWRNWDCYDCHGTSVEFVSRKAAIKFAEEFGDAGRAKHNPELMDKILKTLFLFDTEKSAFNIK